MYTTMLDLGISMILLYLLLSAACSAIQEIVANIFRWRATTLEKGIAGLFRDEKFKEELYKVPLIAGLCSPNARGELAHRPSYIPPATFALAVLDLAAKNGINLAGGPSSPASPPADSGAPALLQSLLLGAKDIEEQKKRIEDWFNGSMDRISGWYKRKAHAILWIIGAILCLLANADSISLANAFWTDPTLRAAMVTAANDYVKTHQTQSTPASGNASPGGTPPSGGTSADNQPSNTNGNAFDSLKEIRKRLATANVPLGWCWVSANSQKQCFPSIQGTTSTPGVDDADPRIVSLCDPVWWILKILGIALTTLAISQGAPFWFDLLRKVANVRLAGSSPEEKKK